MDATQRETVELRTKLQEILKDMKETGEHMKWLRNQKKEIENRLSSLEDETNKSFADKGTFPWTNEVHDRLVNNFKLRKFRGQQEKVINCTLSKKDCIYVAATGSGKSLVFQLPALVSYGITLVVSPLISLMEDQVSQLNELGIEAVVLNSTTPSHIAKSATKAMVDPNSDLKLIYVTPEKLAKSKYLMSQIQKMYQADRFSRLVIDEVHCCSEWGHDFRKDYKQLHIFKREFPGTPVLGLTATATPAVISDIKKILGIPQCLVFKSTFYRPNLTYEIRNTSNKDSVNDIIDFITRDFSNQSGIIYCLTIKETEEVASKLNAFGIPCLAYHAQLDNELRSNIQKQWYSNGCRVIAATVAFGLGINKMDVRFVVHYSISKSLENYYQETGRAGRDGKPAHCVCYYRFADVFRATSITYGEQQGKAHVYDMLRFCLNRQACRKKLIAEHFVDDLIKDGNDTKCCDNCIANVQMMGQHHVDASDWLNTILDILYQAATINEKLTPNMLINAWIQVGGPKRLRLENISKPSLTRVECESVVALLLCDNYLEETFHITPYNVISYIEPGPRAKMFRAGKIEGPKIHSNSFETLPILVDHNRIASNGSVKKVKLETKNKPPAGPSTPSLSSMKISADESLEVIRHLKSEEKSGTWEDYITIDD